MDTLFLRSAITDFLKEDIGTGDITSESIFAPNQTGRAQFVAKDYFITAGIETIAPMVFTTISPDIQCQALNDGGKVVPGDSILEISGSVLDLLKGERVALNLAQRLCGIATLTAEFVSKVSHLPVKIVDTRKTTPGLRVLEKYAVRVGGGHNHRFNLSDGVLIKDNHIAASGSIEQAVKLVRNNAPHTIKIEVEAENLQQVEECILAKVDAILLDNMSPDSLRQAVSLIQGKILLEASGGVNLDNVQEIAETGVNIISIGALTHSAPSCDISMRML